MNTQAVGTQINTPLLTSRVPSVYMAEPETSTYFSTPITFFLTLISVYEIGQREALEVELR